MDRRLAKVLAIGAAMFALSCGVHAANALRCTDDAIAVNHKTAPSMASVVSSAWTRAVDPSELPAAKPATVAQAAPAAGGGGGGAGDDNLLGDASVPPGAHKRGLRWQSFLPGVIK